MIFLKLGGSLITEKDRPETCRVETLQRLAVEIKAACDADRSLEILVGHGSGSYGHIAAARHGTHLGASTPQDWLGFVEVWASAQRLNRLVIDALQAADLPVIAFPPSSNAICEKGTIQEFMYEPLQRALQSGLIPLVHGDVAFDRQQGATIVSTEMVFTHLAARLRPRRVLLAGIEPGVFANFPQPSEILPVLRETDLPNLELKGAQTPDVTGGMMGKVKAALDLAKLDPDMEVLIFSAITPGALTETLLGASMGTRISQL